MNQQTHEGLLFSTNAICPMSQFRKCPRCGNHEPGYQIYRCKHCGKHWCHKSHLFSSSDGCGAGLHHCPHCKREKSVGLFSDSFEQAGTIR